MTIDPWIWTSPKALDKDFCEHLISKFEENFDEHIKGNVFGGVDEEVKRSTDYYITKSDRWKEEQRLLHNQVTIQLEKYIHHIARTFAPKEVLVDIKGDRQFLSTGHQIQRTKPGEYYHWHTDSLSNKEYYRALTYIFYLNDISEGGETEFINGVKIRPQAGKLLIFPATSTYFHRGVSPISETKYISTGWFCHVPDDVNLGREEKATVIEQKQDMTHYIDYTAPKEEIPTNAFFLN